MRLRDISMLVASFALVALAVAALVAAFHEAAPTPVTVHLAIPELASAAAPQPIPETPGEVPPHRPDDGLQLIELESSTPDEATLGVARWVESASSPGRYGWTLTFYRLTRVTDKDSQLTYVGSRFIEDDMGFDAVEFDFAKGYLPADFRKYHDNARNSARDD